MMGSQLGRLNDVLRHDKTEDETRPIATTSAEPSIQVALDSPPDGGWYAWLQVLGAFMLIFNTWGTILIFGDYQTFYESGALFNASSSNISWIGSIQTLLVFLIGVLAGPIYDRGYLRPLTIAGTFGIVFGHMMLSLCRKYWEILLAQGFVIGIGGGCLFVPALAILQQYFRARLGLAVGIAATGSSIGGVIYPVIFTNLISSIGFRWTVRVIGFVALATLSIPIVVLKMRVQPPSVRKLVDVSALKDFPFMFCILGCFLGYVGSFVAFFYIPFYGQATELTRGSLSLYLVPILNASSTFGRVLPNTLADYVGPINVVIPGSLLVGTILLCNLAVHTTAGVICTALFFGFISGIFVATPPLLFVALTPNEAKSKLGARMGMAYAIIGLAVLPGGPGSGEVLQHRHPDPAMQQSQPVTQGSASDLDWTAAWIYAGVLPLAACVVFCSLRFWLVGWKVTVKI